MHKAICDSCEQWHTGKGAVCFACSTEGDHPDITHLAVTSAPGGLYCRAAAVWPTAIITPSEQRFLSAEKPCQHCFNGLLSAAQAADPSLLKGEQGGVSYYTRSCTLHWGRFQYLPAKYTGKGWTCSGGSHSAPAGFLRSPAPEEVL